ncbi:MAG: outer membrane protein assembly factor BamD [Legionellales bacterium]|nr:outer membrane protein assembly factor BamD [Legionellales bacterium]|tara:strand:- start:18740 stop:19552 length:813 start_codon:yes stop_codon:yes gene_type:complete
MRQIALFIIIGLTVILSACSGEKKTPADIFKGQTAEQIFQGGEKALAKGSYKDAIKHFEGLDSLYPFSKYEEQAQLDIIYAYYRDEDYASANAAATRFTRLYPRSAHVDYAYYMKGLSNFNQNRGVIQKYVNVDLSQRDLGTARKSFDDFADLIQRFPKSKYAPDARERMIYLRNLMASYELNVAEFYMLYEDYVAASNRANYIVNHYQQAPAVVPALGIMVQAYRKLHMDKLADETLKVLAVNYPNSETYKVLSGQKKPRKRSWTFDQA